MTDKSLPGASFGLLALVNEFAAMIEFPLDDFQKADAVYLLTPRRHNHLCGMRKIGKTHVEGFVMLLGGCSGFACIYATTKGEYANEVFDFVKPYAEKLKELGLVRRVEPSNGFKNIYFTSGGVNYYRTRSGGQIGRGIMKLDLVIWDEAQKMSAAERREASGALYRSEVKIEIFAGNPATTQDQVKYPDSPFTMMKRRSLKKKLDNWREYSAAAEYSPDLKLSEELLLAHHPAPQYLGDIPTLLKNESETKSHEEVAAELFGIWNLLEEVEHIEPALSAKQAKDALIFKKSEARAFYLSVSIDFKSSEAYAVITDGVITEVADVFELPHGSVEPLSEWILKNSRRFRKIFILGTSKGKTLADLLKKVKGKLVIVNPSGFSVNLNRFMSQLEDGTMKIFATEDVKAVLSSFVIGYDMKTGAPRPQGSTPEQTSLLLSLICAALDEPTLTRINSSNSANTAAQHQKPAKKEVEPAPARDTMAEFLARRKK